MYYLHSINTTINQPQSGKLKHFLALKLDNKTITFITLYRIKEFKI
jgi:hypothetical protein